MTPLSIISPETAFEILSGDLTVDCTEDGTGYEITEVVRFRVAGVKAFYVRWGKVETSKSWDEHYAVTHELKGFRTTFRGVKTNLRYEMWKKIVLRFEETYGERESFAAIEHEIRGATLAKDLSIL